MNQAAKVFLGFLLLVAPAIAQTPQTANPPHHCSVESGGSPPYPESLKGSGIQGTVLLLADIGEDGCTKSVTVVQKLNPKLDELAKRAVASWKFSPAKKDDKPVRVLVRIPVEFKDPGR